MLNLDTIINEFKKQVDAGGKLKEIIPPNENNGQVRIEDTRFTIQLYWEKKRDNEVKLISYKQKKDLDWTRENIDTLTNGDKEKIENEFNTIKYKLLNKNNLEQIQDEIKKEINIEKKDINNGLQGNKENNKESKEIKITEKELDIIENNINEEPEIIQKEINKIDKTIKKHKGRPKKVNKD
jgi:hypothetical protein